MRFPFLFIFVFIFVWALLGQAATVSPITNSFADQVRSGTLTMLSNQNSAVTINVYFNDTYSRPFPSGLSYVWAVGIISCYRTITGTWPVYMQVFVVSAYQSYITIKYYSRDSYTSKLKVSYLVVNSNYISDTFRVFSQDLLINRDINSLWPYTYAYSTPVSISIAGGWNTAIFCRDVRLTNPPVDGYSFKIGINSNGTHITSYTVNSYYSTNTYIQELHFWIICFGYSAFQVSGQTGAWINQYEYVNSNSFTLTNCYLFQYNRWFDTSTNSAFFFGVYGITFTQGFLDFSLSQSTNYLQVVSNNYSALLGVNLFSIPSKICPTAYPYYVPSLDLCSSSCSVIASDYTCSSHPLCPSNCRFCTSVTVCIACSSPNYYLKVNSQCFACQESMEYCQTCLSENQCTNCALGNNVTGGCTSVIGCIEVTNFGTISGPNSFCSQCDQTYYSVNPINNSCICKAGFKAGLYCTQVAGCMSTVNISGKIQCIYCNVQNHFYYDSTTKTCLCNDGFTLKGYNCSDICGDGRVITAACDDGNLIDGDGCSSSCAVELHYKCNTTSTLTPSTCQYVGRNIIITLIATQKSQYFDNRGIFTFAFSPLIPSISKMNLSHYFNFSCESATFEVASWSYQNGKVVLQVDYQTDLEGQLASATFSFNPFLIISWPITVDFSIKSDGMALLLEKTSLNSSPYAYIYLVVAIVALFILVIGSWFQQMVGVQLINALQVIYYTHYTAHLYTPVSKMFRDLSIFGLNLLFVKQNQINLSFEEIFQKIPFSLNDAEVTLLILSSLLGILITIEILSVILSYFSDDSTKIKIKMLRQRFYSSFALPLTLVLFIPAFLVISDFFYLSKSSLSLPLKIINVLILFILAVTSFLFAKNFCQQSNKRQNKEKIPFLLKVNPYYVNVYQIYIFCELILMWLWLKAGVESCSYLLMALCLLMIAWQIIIRPYASALANASIIINICSSLILQVFIVVKNKTSLSLSVQVEFFCYFSFGVLLFLCQLLSIIRIIRVIYLKCTTHQTQKEILQPQPKLKQIETQNKQRESQLYEQYKPNFGKHFIKYIEENANKKDKKIKKRQTKEDQKQTKFKDRLKKDFYAKKIIDAEDNNLRECLDEKPKMRD